VAHLSPRLCVSLSLDLPKKPEIEVQSNPIAPNRTQYDQNFSFSPAEVRNTVFTFLLHWSYKWDCRWESNRFV
jgi:hypothetical protein